MTRVGVVVNPTAGRGRAAGHGDGVADEFHRQGIETIDLSGKDAGHALARARAALDRIDALVVVGGDGMAHLGVNAIAGTGIPLGLVPAGSGNDLARTLRLPINKVPAAVGIIVEALGAGGRRIDAIATTREDDRSFVPTWAACVLSAGIDAAVNARANSYRWPMGAGRYVRGVFAELMQFAPYSYRVTIDGDTCEQPATLVTVANGPTFGGGMRIAPEAKVDDGLLDVVLADGLSRREVLGLFPKLYRGTHVGHPAVQIRRAREVIIEPGPGVRPPRAFADGEDLSALPLTARVAPGAVHLLANTSEV